MRSMASRRNYVNDWRCKIIVHLLLVAPCLNSHNADEADVSYQSYNQLTVFV